MLQSEILAPSQLALAELEAWSRMIAATPHLHRAFFAPGFARACEAGGGEAFIGILHEAGRIRALLPFQFRSPWHRRMRLAERIGGELCDHAGLIAEPGFTIDPPSLLRHFGLGGMFITHLSSGQEGFGLAPESWTPGHLIDVSTGSAAYFATLAAGRKLFVQDTERRLRRAEREWGPLRFTFDQQPALAAVRELIDSKRVQYRRTGVADPFAEARYLRTIDALAGAGDPDCRPVLTALYAGPRIIARHFGLMHRDVLSYWFPVYSHEAQKVSPGRLLLWHTLQQAETCGLRLVDRGEGDSESKRDFSTGLQRFGRANWFAGTARAAVARIWQAAEWRARRLAA